MGLTDDLSVSPAAGTGPARVQRLADNPGATTPGSALLSSSRSEEDVTAEWNLEVAEVLPGFMGRPTFDANWIVGVRGDNAAFHLTCEEGHEVRLLGWQLPKDLPVVVLLGEEPEE